VSGDVIGGEEEKLFRVSNCTGSETTGSGIRTTLLFTRPRNYVTDDCSTLWSTFDHREEV
jgi:hypothetical protein